MSDPPPGPGYGPPPGPWGPPPPGPGYGPPPGPWGPPPPNPGYGPWGPPPPGYPYGPPRPQDHPQGITVLLLGIFGIAMCQILGPMAWVMGKRALAEIDAQPGRYGNRGLVQAGYICGIVGSVILGVYVLSGAAYLVFILVVLGASAAGS